MKGFGLAVYFILLVALTVAGVYFAKYNSDPVVIKFFYMKSSPTAQWIIMLFTFGIGFMLSTLLLTWKLIKVYISRKRYMHSYEQLKSVVEQKIKDLKVDGQE